MKTVYKFALVLLWLATSAVQAKDDLFSVQAEVDKTALTVGDQLHFTLTLKYSPELTVDSLDPSQYLDRFEIKHSASETKKKRSRITKIYSLTLVPWEVGEYEIPALPIEYRDPAGNRKEVFSDPIKIEVKSVLGGAADTADIKELKAQMNLGRSFWFYIGLALMGLLAAGAFYYFLRRKRQKEMVPEVIISPWEKALQELHDLQDASRQGRVQSQEYYFRLSEILRGYLENRFGVPLLERTTEEIEHELEQDFLQPESRPKFLLFLRQSDLIKFAKSKPEEKQLDSDWQLAYQIVQETIPRPQIPKTAEDIKA